jgi:hypothetical protein
MIGMNTTIQKRTPAVLQGRTMSGFDLLTSVPYTLSIAVGAVLVGIVPFRALLIGMACGVGLSAAYAFVTLRQEQSPRSLVPHPEQRDAVPE